MIFLSNAHHHEFQTDKTAVPNAELPLKEPRFFSVNVGKTIVLPFDGSLVLHVKDISVTLFL